MYLLAMYKSSAFEGLADLQTGNRIAVHAPAAGIEWSSGGHSRAARSA